MKNRPNLCWLAAVVISLLLPGTLQAQANFQILDPVQSGAPGSTKTYHAIITNVGSADLYLNADSINVDPGLTLDDTPFFTNFPLLLTPGQSVTDALFQVTLASLLAPGDYFGSFTIQGGADSNASGELGTQSFQITAVSATPSVPEGNSLSWLLGGILPLACLSLWHRSSQKKGTL